MNRLNRLMQLEDIGPNVTHDLEAHEWKENKKQSYSKQHIYTLTSF